MRTQFQTTKKFRRDQSLVGLQRDPRGYYVVWGLTFRAEKTPKIPPLKSKKNA